MTTAKDICAQAAALHRSVSNQVKDNAVADAIVQAARAEAYAHAASVLEAHGQDKLSEQLRAKAEYHLDSAMLAAEEAHGGSR